MKKLFLTSIFSIIFLFSSFQNSFAAWEPGKIGNSYNFSSTYSNWIFLPANATLGDLTINFWIKTTQTARSDVINLSGPTSLDVFFFAPNRTTAGKIDACTYNGSSLCRTSSTSINDGNWHMITATRSGSTLTLYIDGTSEGTASVSSVTIGSGVSVLGTNPGSPLPFYGNIDELSIFSTALSSGTISTMYNSGSGQALSYSTSNLTEYFKFDESCGDFIAREIKLSYNGNLRNDWGLTACSTGGTEFLLIPRSSPVFPITVILLLLVIALWIFRR